MRLFCLVWGHRWVACSAGYHKCSRCFDLAFHPWMAVLSPLVEPLARAVVRWLDADTKRMGMTGDLEVVPELPEGVQELIDMARGNRHLRSRLPAEYRDILEAQEQES